MATGYLAIVLHAHLPFVRHPEDATVMEEQWLYEAITGTYLPLIQMFEGLLADGVRARATVSLSAPLINMLTDDLLKDALRQAARPAHRARRKRARAHARRAAISSATRRCTRIASSRCVTRGAATTAIWSRAFRRLQDAGMLEVITSTATHAYFPNMDRNWAAMRAQVHAAADLYEKHFGRRPRECGSVSAATCRASTSSARSRHPLLLRRHARHPLRRPPPRLRCLRSAVLPERRRRFRARHRVVTSRCGAPKRGTRAIRTTAISTATSASICRWTTSGRTCIPRGIGWRPVSSTTPSPTTSCTTSGSTTRESPKPGGRARHALSR